MTVLTPELSLSAERRGRLMRPSSQGSARMTTPLLPQVAAGRMTAVASRRVGNAVERNRAKRVLRAAVADVGIARGVDVAVVARRGAVHASSTTVAAELRAAWPSGIGAAAVVSS